jgi:inner membrane protein
MDNVTHTLIGVLVGEAAARFTKPSSDGLSQTQRRSLFVTTMAIGSNVPDLDFLYSTITGSKLDYLLHHRGHTHTFVVAALIAGVLWAGYTLWSRRRELRFSHSDRLALMGIALLAPVLHILMDMTNNYGVHPWWPFDNRWTFGDAVFIVEPLLWAAVAPTVFLLRTKVSRGLVALVLIAGVALTFLTGMVPIPIAIAYTVLVAALAFVGRTLQPKAAAMLGLGVWLSTTAGFVYTSHRAGDRVDALAARLFPDAHLLDSVLTPMPVNPLCWEVILVQEESNALVLRRAMLSMAPHWIPAARCPGRSLDSPITAPLQEVAAQEMPELEWYGAIRSDIDTLVSAWRESCQVDALMRFVRAPWLARVEGDLVIGDLRYDRERGRGFSEIEIGTDGEPCPRFVPPWVPPRQDLLERRVRDSK